MTGAVLTRPSSLATSYFIRPGPRSRVGTANLLDVGGMSVEDPVRVSLR